MRSDQSGGNKLVLWGGVAAVIMLGFLAVPALMWVLAFRWLHWSRWVLVPACVLCTLGYFLAVWQALQALSRGAEGARPNLKLLEQVGDGGAPGPAAEAAKAVYEEILEEDEDLGVRAVVKEALERTEGRGQTTNTG